MNNIFKASRKVAIIIISTFSARLAAFLENDETFFPNLPRDEVSEATRIQSTRMILQWVLRASNLHSCWTKLKIIFRAFWNWFDFWWGKESASIGIDSSTDPARFLLWHCSSRSLFLHFPGSNERVLQFCCRKNWQLKFATSHVNFRVANSPSITYRKSTMC